MVEVFKTNVGTGHEASFIMQRLAEEFPMHKINFDLQDCDRILRVEAMDVREEKIISVVTALNYLCEVLE